MDTTVEKLDRLQNAYKSAVESWIAAIRQEEDLASEEHSVAEIDRWEAAARKQQEIGEQVNAAKCAYEEALRRKFFNF
jgi:hypothetical protein